MTKKSNLDRALYDRVSTTEEIGRAKAKDWLAAKVSDILKKTEEKKA